MKSGLTRMSYALVAMASICFFTGIVVLSQPEHSEGAETKWID